MTTIYQNVSTVIDRALSLVSSGINTNIGDLNPSDVTIPAVDFAANVTADIPENPSFSPSAPPTAQATGAVDDAAYSAASSVIGVFSTLTPPSLDFVTPESPDALPNVAAPVPNLAYPEASFISVDESAGLNTPTAPNVLVGQAPDLTEIPELTFDYTPVSLFAGELPSGPQAADVQELVTPAGLVLNPDTSAVNAALQVEPDATGVSALASRQLTQIERQRNDATRQAFIESAAKGMACTSGTLAGALHKVLTDAEDKASDVSAAAQNQVANDAVAVTSAAFGAATTIEQAAFSAHTSSAVAVIQAFKHNANMHIELFNATAKAYNEHLRAAKIIVDMYGEYVKATLAQEKAKNAEISEDRAILTTNKAKLGIYDAQIDTTNVQANIYSTNVRANTLPIKEFAIYLRGLNTNLDIARVNVEAYASAIKGYVSAVDIDKAKISAYGAQVRAEGSATNVYKANWDAYATALGANQSINDAARGFNAASAQAVNAEIGVFRAAADQQRSYIQALTQWISTNNSIVADHSRALQAAVQFASQKAGVSVSLENARLDVELALADTNALQQALETQRQAAQATIDAGLASSEATTYAGLAQAAYAIRSVSASLGSSAGDNTGYNFNSSSSETDSYTRSYSYSKSRSITV